MKTGSCLAGLVLLAACATVPNRGKMVMRDFSFPMKDLRYPSGLRVLVEKDSRSPTVTVAALVGAGSTSDPQGKEGLAHYVEHLTYRARPAGPDTVARLLERAGAGETNAFTAFDETVFYSRGPADALAELLRVEGERLAHPLEGLDPGLAAVEREVVRNELRQRNETGYQGQLLGWVQEAVFGAHPYGRAVGGSDASVSSLTVEDARQFAAAHYRPSNITLVVSGDVDLHVVEQRINGALPAALREGALTAVPSRSVRAPDPVTPSAAREVHKEADVAQPEIWLAWALPRSFGGESAMLEFVTRAAAPLLAVGAWRDEDIADVGVQLVRGVQASLLLCRVTLHTGRDPERSAEKVLNELFQLGLSGGAAASDEVRHGKRRLSAVMNLALAQANPVHRAVARAEYTHFGGDPLILSKTLQGVARVSSTELAAFGAQYLTREQARILYVKPLPPSRAAKKGLVGVAAALPDANEAGLAQPVARLRGATPVPELGRVKRFTLDTGAEVILVPRPGIPVVRVDVALHGGAAVAEPAGADWVAEALARPRSTFNGQPFDIGAHEGSWSTEDLARYRIEGASGNLANLLAMAAERLNSRFVERGSVERFQRFWIEHRAASPELPEVVARRTLMKALYPDHPYGRELSWSRASELSESAVQDWLSRTHRPRNATVVISGELDLAEAEALARKWLSAWSSSGERLRVAAAPLSLAAAPRPVSLLTTERPSAVQGELTLACRLRADDERARARGDLLAIALGDRLQRVLREKLGATYGVLARATLLESGGHLELQTAVENGALAAAFGTLKQEISALQTQPLSIAELNRYKWRLARQYAVAFDSPEELLGAILETDGRGLPLETVDRYPEFLIQLSPQDVQTAFAECGRAGWKLAAVGEPKALELAARALAPAAD